MKRFIVNVGLVAASLLGGVYAARADELGNRVASYAAARVGQKVGDGHSTRLVEQALATAGAKVGGNLQWGRTDVNSLVAGDVIQFKTAVNRKTNVVEACVFKSGGLTWDLTGVPAVVLSAQGTKATILYQDGKGSPVRRLDLDLRWRTSGAYDFFRPIPRLLDQPQPKPLNQLQLIKDAGWENMKAVGQRPLLIILVEDSRMTKFKRSGSWFETLFFGNDPQVRSVNRYFTAVSGGRFSWRRAAGGGVTGPHRFTVRDGDTAGEYIQTDAVLQAARQNWDFSKFDANKDGVVTREELGIVVVDNTKTNGGQTRDVDARIEAQKITVRMPVAAIGPKTDLMTICHEMIHTLGGSDLYGDLKRFGGNGLNFRLSTMGSTGGVDDERITYYLDPWHRMQFGWAEPQLRDMRFPGSFDLATPQMAENSGAKSATALLLFDPGRSLREYFILEYRNHAVGPTGHHDAEVGSTGLAIWHVLQDDKKRLFEVFSDDGKTGTPDVKTLLNRGAPNWLQGGGTLYTQNDGSILLKYMDKTRSDTYLKVLSPATGEKLSVSWTGSPPPVASAPSKPSPATPSPMKPAPGPASAPATPSPIKPPPRALAYIVCSPIDWTQVNLAAGHDWFGSDVPGMREVEPTDAELTAMLKKYGFETQYRRVAGAGGSFRVFLFARLTRETKTPYTDGKRDGVRRTVGAIADMVYGGAKAVGGKVKSVAP